MIDYNMALFKACQSGNITLMKMMISLGARNFNYAFIVACYHDNLEPVKLLLEYKIDTHSLEEGLRYASNYRNLNLIKYLLTRSEYSDILYSTRLIRDIIKYTGPRGLYFDVAKIFMHLGGDIKDINLSSINNKNPKIYLNNLSRVISCKHHLWKIKSVLNDDLINQLLKLI
jgi:ankyrin repeat protein